MLCRSGGSGNWGYYEWEAALQCDPPKAGWRDQGGGSSAIRPFRRVIPRRLRRLEQLSLPGCPHAFVARSPRARLLGLAWLDELPRDCGLLIPDCRSIHTFGMRFPLAVDFLDRNGRVLRHLPAVPPRRMVGYRAAAAVLERPSTRPGR